MQNVAHRLADLLPQPQALGTEAADLSEDEMKEKSAGALLFRIDQEYLNHLAELMTEVETGELLDALRMMRKEIQTYMRKQFPTQANDWNTEEKTMHKLADLNKRCEGNFVKCYTAESIPVYKVASQCFHSPKRIGEDGTLSDELRHCAPFYKGLHEALQQCSLCDGPALTHAWRGVDFDFPNFETYYQRGTIFAVYEPKSLSRNKDVAEKFAGPDGTIFKFILKTAYQIHESSFFPTEQELLVQMGTKLEVLDVSVVAGSPNQVTLMEHDV